MQIECWHQSRKKDGEKKKKRRSTELLASCPFDNGKACRAYWFGHDLNPRGHWSDEVHAL